MSWYNPVPKDNVNVVSGWGEYQLQGNGVPNDATGKLGDTYLNVADNRLYLKRWVANREGSGDSILFPINLFPSVGDFDISMLTRLDNTPDSRLWLVAAAPGEYSVFNLYYEGGQTIHNCILRKFDTSAQFSQGSSVTNNAWHRVGARRIDGTLIVYRDNTNFISGINTSAWDPSLVQTGTYILKTPQSLSLSMKACDIKITSPGGKIISPLNEGTGTTITNQAGANGTLTDGTPANFWYQSWVPMDLL